MDADALINGDRQAQYGPPSENFARIAAGWSVILGTDVTPDKVALCMAWLKIARLAQGPHRDSYVDGAGYMALAAEMGLASPDPVPHHRRSPMEHERG
jgi:hypothetical protein